MSSSVYALHPSQFHIVRLTTRIWRALQVTNRPASETKYTTASAISCGILFFLSTHSLRCWLIASASSSPTCGKAVGQIAFTVIPCSFSLSPFALMYALRVLFAFLLTKKEGLMIL